MSVDKVKVFWDERYAKPGYAYGSEPNLFFKSIIDKLPVGKVLIPAAGQGRDAVYAATLGWEVDAFDLSDEGRKVALELANKRAVEINFEVENAFTYHTDKKYDLILLVYFHIPASKRSEFHKKLSAYLAPNGLLALEAFSKKQIERNSGGPKDEDMLMNVDELKSDFANLNTLQCYETSIHLKEGENHDGDAEVVRYVGRKIV